VSIVLLNLRLVLRSGGFAYLAEETPASEICDQLLFLLDPPHARLAWLSEIKIRRGVHAAGCAPPSTPDSSLLISSAN
jgi:hypothetical protein